jgi:hypothetical protein
MKSKKDINDLIIETELNKTQIKKLVNDEFEKLIKKKEKDYLTKEDVKDMIRKTIVKQYKYLWEKSAFFINQI